MEWLSGWSVIGETHGPCFEPWSKKFNFHIFLLFYYIQNLGIDGGGIDEPPLQLDENLHKMGGEV